MFKPAELLDLSQTEHAALFEGCEFAWDALRKLEAYIARHLRPGLHNHCDGVAYIAENVYIGPGTVVEDGAMIKGPTIIGRNCQIRHNAYIREHVVIGDECVVGNASEVKHSFLFNNAVAPHFNYIGDSVLGHGAHLGAGAKLSNVKLLPGNVQVEADGKRLDTGLRKFGAVLGDHSEIGCNAVLNPGSVIGRESIIYANVNWRGVLPAGCVAKHPAERVVVPRRKS